MAKAWKLVTDRPFPKRHTFYISKDGKVAFIDVKVKTDSHGKDIAAKLKELKFELKKDAKELVEEEAKEAV